MLSTHAHRTATARTWSENGLSCFKPWRSPSCSPTDSTTSFAYETRLPNTTPVSGRAHGNAGRTTATSYPATAARATAHLQRTRQHSENRPGGRRTARVSLMVLGEQRDPLRPDRRDLVRVLLHQPQIEFLHLRREHATRPARRTTRTFFPPSSATFEYTTSWNPDIYRKKTKTKEIAHTRTPHAATHARTTLSRLAYAHMWMSYGWLYGAHHHARRSNGTALCAGIMIADGFPSCVEIERSLQKQFSHTRWRLRSARSVRSSCALAPALRAARCSSRSVAILPAVSARAWDGGRRSPDREPEVEEGAVLEEGAQRRVVHAEEEVRLTRLDGLAPVERGARGALRAVEEQLVELGAARVVARGDGAYWRGASARSGGARARGDALVVYRKGLVLRRFCGVWMTGSQTQWNIWMGGSARMGRGEAHARGSCHSSWVKGAASDICTRGWAGTRILNSSSTSCGVTIPRVRMSGLSGGSGASPGMLQRRGFGVSGGAERRGDGGREMERTGEGPVVADVRARAVALVSGQAHDATAGLVDPDGVEGVELGLRGALVVDGEGREVVLVGGAVGVGARAARGAAEESADDTVFFSVPGLELGVGSGRDG